MIKFLAIVIFSLLLNASAHASSVNEYLKLGYKLHSINLSNDASALFYHLTTNLKKDKKDILNLKKEKKIAITTCIVNAASGVTIKCYQP